MIKKYIKWDRVKLNDNRYIDVNTDNAFINATEGATFTETAYNVGLTFLGIVEYPDNTTQEQIDGLITEYSDFNFTFITEAEANTFLESLADDTGGVTVSNFIFSDTRVFDLI